MTTKVTLRNKLRAYKTDKFGNFTNIYIHNMHLSVNAPNNYVLTNIGCIFKIQEIFQDDFGSFKLIGNRIKSVHPFYEKSIASNLLNIYVSETDETTINIKTVRVTKDLRKMILPPPSG